MRFSFLDLGITSQKFHKANNTLKKELGITSRLVSFFLNESITIKNLLDKKFNSNNRDSLNVQVNACKNILVDSFKRIFGRENTLLNCNYFIKKDLDYFKNLSISDIKSLLLDHYRAVLSYKYLKLKSNPVGKPLERQILEALFIDPIKKSTQLDSLKIPVSPRSLLAFLNEKKIEEWLKEHQGIEGYYKAGQELKLNPKNTFVAINKILSKHEKFKNKTLYELLHWKPICSNNWDHTKKVINLDLSKFDIDFQRKLRNTFASHPDIDLQEVQSFHDNYDFWLEEIQKLSTFLDNGSKFIEKFSYNDLKEKLGLKRYQVQIISWDKKANICTIGERFLGEGLLLINPKNEDNGIHKLGLEDTVTKGVCDHDNRLSSEEDFFLFLLENKDRELKKILPPEILANLKKAFLDKTFVLENEENFIRELIISLKPYLEKLNGLIDELII